MLTRVSIFTVKYHLDSSQAHYKCKLLIEAIFVSLFVPIKNVGCEPGHSCQFTATLLRSTSNTAHISLFTLLKQTNRLFQHFPITLSNTQSLSISRQKDTCVQCISPQSVYRQNPLLCLEEAQVDGFNGHY